MSSIRDADSLTALRRAYEVLATVGWWRGDATGDVSVVVFADGEVRNARDVGNSAGCECLATSVDFNPGALVLIGRILRIKERKELEVRIYQANDGRPATQESRLWAIDVIRRAIALAEKDEVSARSC